MFWNRPKPTAPEADAIAQANGRARDAEAERDRYQDALEYLKSAPWPEERGKKWVRDYCDAVLAGADMSVYGFRVYSRSYWPGPSVCPTCQKPASVDTHPKGGDSEAAPAPLSGAVPCEDTGDAR